MKKQIFILIGFLAIISTTNVLAESKAMTYQDCILEVTRDGFFQSRRDVGRIKELCEERFPDTAPVMLGDKLNNEALDKIEIYTNRTDKGEINGTVYNGNSYLIVTRLDLLITPKTKKGSVEDFFDSEDFELNLKVKPYATESFTIEPEKTNIDGQFSWKLIRAWGY
ncbi:MAG: hypothetical protein JXA04_03080 [Gammaproteobacteria bacterium]|nr:hypothetical protein [Gammaproteobacteria bacterium]